MIYLSLKGLGELIEFSLCHNKRKEEKIINTILLLSIEPKKPKETYYEELKKKYESILSTVKGIISKKENDSCTTWKFEVENEALFAIIAELNISKLQNHKIKLEYQSHPKMKEEKFKREYSSRTSMEAFKEFFSISTSLSATRKYLD